MNPLEPFDLAPKDGDFARYIDDLVAQSGQRLRAGESADRAASQRETESPNAGAVDDRITDNGVDLQAGRTRDRIAARFLNSGRPNASDTASNPQEPEHFGRSAKVANDTRALPPKGRIPPNTTSLDGPPDLAVLWARVAQRLSQYIGGLGALWLVLGAFLAVPFFADTLFVAVSLIFFAVFLHNQRRRPAAPAANPQA